MDKGSQRARLFLTLTLIVCVMAGVLARFHGLGRQSLWFNEAASHYYAKGTVLEVVRHSYTIETNPPGFHLLVHFWMGVAGIKEWALRLPSAVAGCVSLMVMFFFSRMFLGRAGSVVAVCLLALSPLHVWYSQECRAFAIWVFFILCAYLNFLKWEKSGGKRSLLLWNGVFIFLAVSFHYFGLHLVLIENAFLILTRGTRERAKWKEWAVSQAVLAVFLAPLVWMMLSVDKSHVSWWQESGVQLSAVKSLFFHLNGVYFLLSPERLVKVLLLAANVGVLCLGIYAMRRDKRLVFLVLAVGMPIILNLSYSFLVSPIFGNAQSAGRYFLLTLPPYLILLAAGWERVLRVGRGRACWAVLLLSVLVLNGWGVAAARRESVFSRDDNRRLCGLIYDGAREGDLLVVSPIYSLDYYADLFAYDLDKLRVVSLHSREEDLKTLLPEQADRVWAYFDPAHHFEDVLELLKSRYGLEITLSEKERRLSSAGLFLLEVPKSEGAGE